MPALLDDELEAEVLKLRAVTYDWDGRGGEAPHPKSIDLMVDFLPTIRSVPGLQFVISHNADGYPVVRLVGLSIQDAALLFDGAEDNVVLTVVRIDKTISIVEFDAKSTNSKAELRQRLETLVREVREVR